MAMLVDVDIFPTLPEGTIASYTDTYFDEYEITVAVFLAPESLSLKVIIPVSMGSAILSLIITVYAIKSGYSCSNMRKDAKSAAKSEIVIENAYQTTGVQASTDNSSVLYINKKSRTTPLTSNITQSIESSAVKQAMPSEGYISLAKAKERRSAESTSSGPSNMETGSSPQDCSTGYVSHNDLVVNTVTMRDSNNGDSKTTAIHEMPKSAGKGKNVRFNDDRLEVVKGLHEYITLAQVNALKDIELQSESEVDKMAKEHMESSVPVTSLTKSTKKSLENGISSEPSDIKTVSKPRDGSPGYVSLTELMVNKDTIEGSTNSNSQTIVIHEKAKSAGEGERVNSSNNQLKVVKSLPEYVTLAQVNGLANSKLQSDSQVDKVSVESIDYRAKSPNSPCRVCAPQPDNKEQG